MMSPLHENAPDSSGHPRAGRDAAACAPAACALEDQAVIRRVLAGERDAFRLLVEKYQRLVFGAALRVVRDPDEAEDLAQETFVKAYSHLAQYDARWAFATWLLTIATRTALNAARGSHSRVSLNIEDLPPALAPTAPAGGSPRYQASHREWRRHLRREVEALGEKMRLVFGLRYEDQRSIAEIAEITRSSESAIKVQLHRARKILREKLKEFADLI